MPRDLASTGISIFLFSYAPFQRTPDSPNLFQLCVTAACGKWSRNNGAISLQAWISANPLEMNPSQVRQRACPAQGCATFSAPADRGVGGSLGPTRLTPAIGSAMLPLNRLPLARVELQ